MVFLGKLKKVSWLVLLILVNAVHFGEGLAADRNHRWSADEPAAADVENVNKEDAESVVLQHASHSHSQRSVAMNGSSANHSLAEEPDREASDKLLELTVANRSLSRIYSLESTNTSVSKGSANKTAANLNVSSTEHASNDSTRSNMPNSADALNYSQDEDIVRATLCANSSVEKDTMRVEVEFASTLLENGLYYFITCSKNNGYK